MYACLRGLEAANTVTASSTQRVAQAHSSPVIISRRAGHPIDRVIQLFVLFCTPSYCPVQSARASNRLDYGSREHHLQRLRQTTTTTTTRSWPIRKVEWAGGEWDGPLYWSLSGSTAALVTMMTMTIIMIMITVRLESRCVSVGSSVTSGVLC